jgi:hypothetical protein
MKSDRKLPIPKLRRTSREKKNVKNSNQVSRINLSGKGIRSVEASEEVYDDRIRLWKAGEEIKIQIDEGVRRSRCSWRGKEIEMRMRSSAEELPVGTVKGYACTGSVSMVAAVKSAARSL